MLNLDEIKIMPGEIFYAAITPRSLGSKPSDIDLRYKYKSYDEAFKATGGYACEDGRSIFIKRNKKWIEVVKDNNKHYIFAIWDEDGKYGAFYY